MNAPAKSCFSCPSLLTHRESIDFFGKSIGTPVCARFGKPIGTMNSDEAQTKDVARKLAENCDQHGKARPAATNWQTAQFKIALDDTAIMVMNPKRSQEMVGNCQMCEHYVRPDVVHKELGFGSGMCSAKGRLLLQSRLTFEARNCDERSFVQQGQGTRTDVSNIVMLPEYAGDFTLSVDPIKYHKQMKQQGFVDPVDYPTDREVSAEEDTAGIRAFRRIVDPRTKNEVFLPIYKLDYFNDEERAKIPRTGDDEHPEDYLDHNFFTYKVSVLWTELDETPGFWGEAGTGKTEFFRYMAWLMCLPFERFSITGSTDLDDLAGKMHYSPEKGTYWSDGRLVEAWSKPCVLVVDEPNTGPPDVWQFLRPMTDNSKQLVLDQNDGERKPRHDDCYLGLAMNPAWDPKNVGTHMVSDADVNRLMHIFVERPPAELEREIIIKRCNHDNYKIAPETLDTIMKIATDIRALSDEDTVPISWAIRPQLKVARSSRWFTLEDCYRMATADFLEPAQAEQIMDVVNSHVE